MAFALQVLPQWQGWDRLRADRRPPAAAADPRVWGIPKSILKGFLFREQHDVLEAVGNLLPTAEARGSFRCAAARVGASNDRQLLLCGHGLHICRGPQDLLQRTAHTHTCWKPTEMTAYTDHRLCLFWLHRSTAHAGSMPTPTLGYEAVRHLDKAHDTA